MSGDLSFILRVMGLKLSTLKTYFEPMRLEDPSEKGPHVPPFVLVIKQNGFHFVLIIHRFVIWRVLNIWIRIRLLIRFLPFLPLTLVWPEGAPVRALPGL